MKAKRGQTMVATLIVIAIILVLIVIFFRPTNSPSPRADKKGYTTMGLARLSALDTQCKSDIDQLRFAIQTAKTSSADDTFPATLQDTHLGPEFFKCPVGGENYVYDPTTGQVHCPHPGHERY